MLKHHLIIADLGSTKTKAALFSTADPYRYLISLAQADTTVESPHNDVKAGLWTAIHELQNLSGIKLLKGSHQSDILNDDVSLLCSSSAGGGLQILVVGLTLFDSASSGKRAAYGAGGVILDTFAIDDRRTALQQMFDMRNLHPDMILISGGTDGGAISGVLRLAEILRLANPAPKYQDGAKIPTLYAGNKDAADLIRNVIGKDFDLQVLPNLRPSLQTENLEPTRDIIQKLFMENVMERAPGYKNLKDVVSDDILPTPLAVMQTQGLLSQNQSRNTFAFDIGGATTDVFSHINGHFQRTVSANLGMSFSALNLLKEAGIEKLSSMLPPEISESDLRDYTANKTIYPTKTYNSRKAYIIEHALAKAALSLALLQHQQMHYNTSKIGFLDALKAGERDKYQDKFEYIHQEEKFSFFHTDIHKLIGIGGVFTATQNPLQASMILIDAIRPKGITEIMMDTHFLSPHLGLMSKTSPEAAKHLIQTELIQKLALHVSPTYNPKTKPDRLLLSLSIDGAKHDLYPGQLIYIPPTSKSRKFSIDTQPKVFVTEEDTSLELASGIPLILDSRSDEEYMFELQQELMNLYPPSDQEDTASIDTNPIETGQWIKHLELSFKGVIDVSPNSTLHPDMQVAHNPYDPPRLYIVQPFTNFQDLSPQEISRALLVQKGQHVEADELVMKIDFPTPAGTERLRSFNCPVRGKVEYIDPLTGILILSEIQDYDAKPKTINIANALGVKPGRISPYLRLNKGDFVTRGEVIARKLDNNKRGLQTHVKAPTTGTITEIDPKAGCVTIQYLAKPSIYLANVFGKLLEADEDKYLKISYEGWRMEASIGFGRESSGTFRIVTDASSLANQDLSGTVLYLDFSPSSADLSQLAKQGAQAVICSSMAEKELSLFMEFEPGVINTGNENIPMSVLILNGFGSQYYHPGYANLLAQYENKHVYICPQTRIRAGVLRPFCCFQEKKT